VKKKEEGGGVGATSKYCAKIIDDDEDGSTTQRQGGQGETAAQGNGDDLNALGALFKPLSSSHSFRLSPVAASARNFAYRNRCSRLRRRHQDL
jgi:hypothetical protein